MQDQFHSLENMEISFKFFYFETGNHRAFIREWVVNLLNENL